MNWIKVQIVFDSGAPDVSWIVNSAHANGIKVLLGVIGNRSRFADRGYYPTYAAGVAAMAKQGADAIEIWNEPNLTAKWVAPTSARKITPNCSANRMGRLKPRTAARW